MYFMNCSRPESTQWLKFEMNSKWTKEKKKKIKIKEKRKIPCKELERSGESCANQKFN